MLSALELMAQNNWRQKIMLADFKASQGPEVRAATMQTRYLGRLHDDLSLRMVYAAADVFVAPSLEDNLPNAVLEALACGTPAVAFDIGGLSDLIDHQENGYLARAFDIQDLARGIEWVIADPERHQALSRAARAKAEREYSIPQVAGKYLALFEEILSK